jgi:hypothetical protein
MGAGSQDIIQCSLNLFELLCQWLRQSRAFAERYDPDPRGLRIQLEQQPSRRRDLGR